MRRLLSDTQPCVQNGLCVSCILCKLQLCCSPMRSPKQRMAATLATARQLALTPTEDRRLRAATELATEAAQLLEVAVGFSGR